MDVSGDRPQELRRSLELSANAQRRQGDCPSDDYDSIEEDITSEPEPEPEGCPGGDCPLSTGDKDAPEDREAGGRPPQGPDTLVVLEFNPASQRIPPEPSSLTLRKHFLQLQGERTEGALV
ncbi:katanin-interacting protein-like isoform X6 [Lepus europaeus]|uniref:katanin-interacting protein-like isoform X6 n=1 Tax=Lepus europaeus TaxID=9983 RepID=UPI002B49C60D|nr:katanin-interacting protein-like isoform X6 [Lepus europaeus]